MMLALSAVLALFAQQAGQTVFAVYDGESWTLEYPALISGQVDRYNACVKGGSYAIGDGRGFEEQYLGDIPRCAKLGAAMEGEANAVLERRGRSAETTPDDVARIFETVRQIHYARGRSLDRAIRTRLADSATPPPEAGECIARVRDLQERRDAFSTEQSAALRPVYDKTEYTAEDQRAIAAYQSGLRRYSTLINQEMRGCPAAATYPVPGTGNETAPNAAEGNDASDS